MPPTPEPQSAASVWTVSELTARVQRRLQSEFARVWVAGELSQITRAASGHVYLTLKDEAAVLRGIMWRRAAMRLPCELVEGLEVVVRGSLDVYPPRGSYQIIIEHIEPRGIGALELAFRQMKERLEQEGLFDPEHKKPLPRFPRRIGIVTSPTGAAVRDMINVISRRWPAAEMFLLPRRVQGEGAAEEIAAGLIMLNARRPDLDVIIVGRGGGSLEDLWAFNEEVVARAIYESDIPVVSAVGHEVDFSISDFVADVRAATPTEAGELVVPNAADVHETLRNLRRRAARRVATSLREARQRLRALVSRPVIRRPETLLRERAQRADDLLERLRRAMAHRLTLARERLAAVHGRVEALSPLRVLDRGYSVTLGPDGDVLRSAADVAPGDEIRTRLAHGEVESQVTASHPEADQGDASP